MLVKVTHIDDSLRGRQSPHITFHGEVQDQPLCVKFILYGLIATYDRTNHRRQWSEEAMDQTLLASRMVDKQLGIATVYFYEEEDDKSFHCGGNTQKTHLNILPADFRFGSTNAANQSFEELRGKKDRLSKKQSSSLDAITSVIPEYSGVGHRVRADRSISGDEVSRDNNRIIEIPTRANPARAERSKRTSPGNQAVDGSTIKLREENIDIPSGGNSVSSRTSSVCTKKRRTFPKLFSKPGNTKGRRGRRLSHGSSRNWRSVLLRARRFYKFTRQFSEKYSSPLHVSELSLQIGTSTITQSGAIGNTQAGADQSIEQIKSASPSQEVLTQNIYPGVRIIDQENEEEFEEINFISSFSFRGTSPESEQAEPSGQSKQVRESISPEPEKTITREQSSSLRRTSPAGGQAEPSGQSKTIRESVSPEPEKTITKEQTLDGIFADFGESRTIEIASSIIGKVKIDNDSSLGDKTQVWLNCEDPEKGNMDNDNKLRDKTQVWLNCEDPDKVEIDNDSSLGDKTHDCLRQYYENPESFKEPQGYSRRNIVAADFFCEPKDFSRQILTVSENINEPEVYPRRSLVASESLKEPKVDLRRSFEATDFFCKPMEVAEDLKEPTFYNEVPKDLNSDLSLDLRSSDYLKQSKKIETEYAIANEEKERS
ncbi:hypothetical protein DAPPUDRAFT_335522, partial [Daphnia pulex]